MSSTSIVAYLVLFAAVASLFLLVALLLGRLLRASAPTPQKLEAYECGEPPIGSSFVQFDLRFYVVALVFIIFEVELALFFPPATIFGKATQVMGGRPDDRVRAEAYDRARAELGIGDTPQSRSQSTRTAAAVEPAHEARRLSVAAMADLAVFFAMILVAFAYVWWQGDLNWVRAIARPADGEGIGAIEGAARRVQGPGFRIQSLAATTEGQG